MKLAEKVKLRRSIHADFHPLVVCCRRPVKADFHFVQVDVDHFLTIGANLRYLPVEIDRITAAGTAGDDNTNDLCFLLHVDRSFRI